MSRPPTERRVMVLVGVALLALSAILGTVALGASSGGADGGEWSLSELRRGGEVIDPRYPSLRKVGEFSAIWAVHYPPDPFTQYGKGDGKFVEPSSVIQRDKFRLLGTHKFDGEIHRYNLTVVYWRAEKQTVSTGNGSRTETVANVLGVDTQTVRFGPGFRRSADVELRRFTEEVRVTVLAKQEGEVVARWLTRHESIPYSSSVSVDTEGDFWLLFGRRVGMWSLPAMLLFGWFGYKHVQIADAGPMLPGLAWGVGAAGLLMVVATFAFVPATTLLVRFPQVAALGFGAVAYLLVISYAGRDVSRTLFQRFETERVRPIAESARDVEETEADVVPDGGSEAERRFRRDALYADAREERIVPAGDTGSGAFSIVRPGLRRFIARLWAEPARLELTDLRTEVELDSGRWDRIVYADPDTEELLKLTPPRIRWRPRFLKPAEEDAEEGGLLDAVKRINVRYLALSGLGLVAGLELTRWAFDVDPLAASGTLPYPGLLVGLIPAVILAFEARDGAAEFDPAPIHHRDVVTTVTTLERETEDARTFEELVGELTKARSEGASRALEILRAEGEAQGSALADALGDLGAPDPEVFDQPEAESETEPDREEAASDE